MPSKTLPILTAPWVLQFHHGMQHRTVDSRMICMLACTDIKREKRREQVLHIKSASLSGHAGPGHWGCDWRPGMTVPQASSWLWLAGPFDFLYMRGTAFEAVAVCLLQSRMMQVQLMAYTVRHVPPPCHGKPRSPTGLSLEFSDSQRSYNE